MINESQFFNLAAIRSLLEAAFGKAADLRRFCQDRPAFRPIVNVFGSAHGLDDMIADVVDYCETRLLFHELLREVQEYNPAQYARFEQRLTRPTRGAPHSSQFPLTPERYILASIKQLLLDGFNVQELMGIETEVRGFKPAFQYVPANPSKAELIASLVQWAEHKRLMDSLLDWAREHNRDMYAEHQPYWEH